MGKGKDRITRSSLQATAFHDDYDYHTLGSPPEVAPARKRKLTNVSPYHSEYPTETKLHDESMASLESLDVNPYKREPELRRARLPYIKDQELGLPKTDNTRTSRKAGQAQKLTQRLLQLEWLITKNAGTRTVYLPLETTKLNTESSLLWG